MVFDEFLRHAVNVYSFQNALTIIIAASFPVYGWYKVVIGSFHPNVSHQQGKLGLAFFRKV